MSANPYAPYMEGVDLLRSLAETPQRVARLVAGWTDTRLETPYAPGKWSVREILVHLAQCELVFGTRLRFGVTERDYVVQPFDQDEWMRVEEPLAGSVALDTYLAVRRMNLDLCRRLTPDQLARPLRHPERGPINVEWIMRMFAGHERHHLLQLETIEGV